MRDTYFHSLKDFVDTKVPTRKRKLNKHVDYASNWVIIDVLVPLEEHMIGVDALY